MTEKPKKKFGGEKPLDKKQPEKQSRKPQQAASSKPIISPSGKEVKGIVRLAGRDLRGTFPLHRAITSVKGIGINVGKVASQVAYRELGANDKTMVGELSEAEIEKLEQILFNLDKHGMPERMFNRQKDLFTGTNKHLIGSDLTFTVRQDIDHEKDSYTWKGYRHTYGQKVRGQRTRSTGRTGMTVGVLRKAVKAGATAPTGAAAQAASAPGAAAPAAGAKAPAAGAAAPKAAGPAPAAKAAPAKKEEPKK